MSSARACFPSPHRRGVLLATAGAIVLLLVVGAPVEPGHGSPAGLGHGASLSFPRSSPESAGAFSGPATSIEPVGAPPSAVTAGTPLAVAWVAMTANDTRATSFSAPCYLSVTQQENGSSEPVWVNSSTAGPLDRAANGTFGVPSSAWAAGRLNLTLTFADALPVSVGLGGGLLPALPPPLETTVTADLDHLVLYEPQVAVPEARANDTFWHVRDRFGDPAPGAFLVVEYWTEQTWSSSLVPVTWTTGGSTGAWVNYSAPSAGNATVRVADEANATLLGPIAIPALGTAAASPAAPLPTWVEAAVALLGVAGISGMVGLVLGPRRRPKRSTSTGAEELRRLAEGRETVVELLRRSGAMDLAEIEAAWEPPPAPPAVADWVASLVTDGTLTATVADGGRARFALADRPSATPKVTLDEEAMRREVARRDAATNEDGDGDGTG